MPSHLLRVASAVEVFHILSVYADILETVEMHEGRIVKPIEISVEAHWSSSSKLCSL